MRQQDDKKSMTLIEAIKEYIDLKLEFFQLAFAERVSLIIGSIIFFIFISLLGLAMFLLLIVLLYTLLMTWIGIPWLVCLIEIAFVGLVIVLFWFLRRPLIIKPVANMIIGSLLDPSGKIKTKEDDEDEE